MSADHDRKFAPEFLADYHIFRVLRKRGTTPRTGGLVEFHTLAMNDWVQVIARTKSGAFILVDQFRPGAEISSLEFPAGIVDRDEDAVRAGLRELEEETGYQPEQSHYIGSLFANPAIQSNRLHIVLALDCALTGSLHLDDGEDVTVRLVAEDELTELMRNGGIVHALVLSAWQLYGLWRVQRPASRT